MGETNEEGIYFVDWRIKMFKNLTFGEEFARYKTKKDYLVIEKTGKVNARYISLEEASRKDLIVLGEAGPFILKERFKSGLWRLPAKGKFPDGLK